jgi:NADPH:quinone reductase
MQSWVCNSAGGLDDLVWDWVPTPELDGGDLLVEVRAASLNFPDLLMLQGKYQFKPKLPFVPGAEFSGEVISVGRDVTNVVVGQSIACVCGTGAFSSHAVVPARDCLVLPAGVPYVEAATLVMTYGTAYHALIDRARLAHGETVLVLGAAGGVGSAAIQVAKAAGARVIAAASTDRKAYTAKTLGADAIIDTSREQLRDAIRNATNGRGPDVIVDPVGGAQTEAAFRSIAWRGRHLVIGFADGAIPALPLNLALLKGASMVGVFWGEFAKREPEASAANLQQILKWYLAGVIKPLIDSTFQMRDVRQAFEKMATRSVRGKIVLRE